MITVSARASVRFEETRLEFSARSNGLKKKKKESQSWACALMVFFNENKGGDCKVSSR